jgi:sarcosine oxidase
VKPRKVLIVGAGIAGLAIALRLVERGLAPIVVDRGSIPNPRAASYDNHRLTRIPYGDQDGYAAAMPEAFAAWDRLWTKLGARLWADTGALCLSTAEGDWTDRSRSSLDRIGAKYELLDRTEIERRFPVLHAPDARFGLWTRPGGVLFADRIVEALAWRCAEQGVRMLPNVEIVALDPPRAKDGTVFDVDLTVVCAGAWLGELVPDMAARAIPVRQIVAYVTPTASMAALWRGMPAMLDLGGPQGPRGMFLAPDVEGRGLKLGCTLQTRNVERAGTAYDPHEGQAVLGAYKDRFVDWGGYRLAKSVLCHWTRSPEDKFIFERRGANWIVSACSGHGFKFGALTGERAGDAIAEDRESVEL